MNVSTARVSCSALARERGEPLYGTAPSAQAWILLEQPGAWGPDAVFESALNPRVAAELTKRTAAMSCRILMIRRRSGRYESDGVTAYLANCSTSGTWMEQVKLGSASDLLDVELETLVSPEPPGIGARAEAAFLVCTHGKRDPCCAEFGRALVGSLASLDPAVWESSHQGGHRFAANLACFPHALFYGRVGRLDGEEILATYRRRELYLPCLRGRSAYDSIVQSADTFARVETGITGIDALRLERATHLEGKATVTFRSETGAPHTVELELRIGEPRRESCLKDKLSKSEVWVRI